MHKVKCPRCGFTAEVNHHDWAICTNCSNIWIWKTYGKTEDKKRCKFSLCKCLSCAHFHGKQNCEQEDLHETVAIPVITVAIERDMTVSGKKIGGDMKGKLISVLSEIRGGR